MKYIIIFGLLAFTSSSYAFNVDKNHVSSMIDQMVEKGIIPKGEANQAKQKLLKMNDKQWESVQAVGRDIANENPEMAKTNTTNSVDSASSNIDFDSKAFSDIQKQVEGAMQD